MNIERLKAQALQEANQLKGHMSPKERAAWKAQGKSDADIQSMIDKRAAFNKKLRKESNAFEALFLQKILSDVRKHSGTPTILDGGRGEKIFRDMLEQKYAERMSQTRSFGLGNFIFEHYKK